MSGPPYRLDYPTRLRADEDASEQNGKIIVHRLFSMPAWGDRADQVPFNLLLAKLAESLTQSWLDVAEKFTQTAFSAGQPGCSTLLLTAGTSKYFEVYTRGLTPREAERALAFARDRSHNCGSYEAGQGRAMWVEFTHAP